MNRSIGLDQVITAIKHTGRQLQLAWDSALSLTLPDSYYQPLNIVFAGMGGSHLSADIIHSIYQSTAKVPILIHHDYAPPFFVGERTIFIATSYSGNTEEIISQTSAAKGKGAKIICISSGGELAEYAASQAIPQIVFDDSTYNPGNIPRYGNGFLLGAQLGLLSRLEIIGLDPSEMSEFVQIITQNTAKLDARLASISPQYIHIAESLQNKQVILISAEHLYGAAYFFKNLLDESAKTFSDLFSIPELNHHLLEGLQYPTNLENNSIILMHTSRSYHPRVQKRFHLTKSVFVEQGYTVLDLPVSPNSLLLESAQLYSQAMLISLYLSRLNHVDPAPNPWVDYFKKKLSQ